MQGAFVEFRKKDTPSSSMSQQLVLYTENVLVSEACIVSAEKASQVLWVAFQASIITLI